MSTRAPAQGRHERLTDSLLGVNGVFTARAVSEVDVAWLDAATAPSGELGRRARANQRTFGPGDETAAREAIERVVTLAGSLDAGVLASLRNTFAKTPDPGPALAKCQIGEEPDDVALFELARFCAGARHVRSLLGDHLALHGCVPEAAPAALLEPFGDGETFYIGSAEPGLAQARAELESAQALYDEARSRLAATVATAAGLERIHDGNFVLMRAGLLEIPPGVHVIRETPAYLLCELVLDAGALAAQERRNEARSALARAEDKARGEVSGLVRTHGAWFAGSAAALAALDALLGHVTFAQRYPGCVPQFSPEPRVEIAEAHYPPLEERLAKAGRRYVPLTFALEGVAVLSGPNMGGKSAVLRTLGFVSACVARGIPPPAHRARLSLFGAVAWLGPSGSSGAGELSAFGLEIVELRELLATLPQRPLVLIDEFARTTAPAEGTALLVALLGELRARGAGALAATHLSGIAARAGVRHFAVAGIRAPLDGATILDPQEAIVRIGEAMDYRVAQIQRDERPAGEAIELAQLLGLDPSLVARARAALRA